MDVAGVGWGLQSMGSQRVGQSELLSMHARAQTTDLVTTDDRLDGAAGRILTFGLSFFFFFFHL